LRKDKVHPRYTERIELRPLVYPGWDSKDQGKVQQTPSDYGSNPEYERLLEGQSVENI